MTFSLNEVEAIAKKAARGAGYPWGLAEEAGRATRWLAAHGLDGCAALAGLLEAVDGAPPTPQPGPIWEAASGRLCPVATGAALSDHAHALGAETRLGAITQPLLLLPFAAFLARDKGTISVAWEGGGAVTDGQVSTHGTTPAWSLWATLRLGGTLEAPRAPGSRADPAPEAWASLAAFAHRTYAPATEESRQKGAGPSDTD